MFAKKIVAYGARKIHDRLNNCQCVQSVTVSCGFSIEGAIGTFFFGNYDVEAVTVNGKRDRDTLTGCFWYRLKGLDLADI